MCMSQHIDEQAACKANICWNDIVRYAATDSSDQPFVNEVSYMIVTLYRTGV